MKRYLALFLLVPAVTACDAMTAHTDVVARAGQHELTVDETVDLLAGYPQIPAEPQVVESVANLWVDYTILAEMASEDSTMAGLSLDAMIEPYVQAQTFQQLREQVVTTDTVISDEELAELYAEQAPGIRLRARHILLSMPDDASEAERDSVFALAESLRERAVSGEDFAALAREYSTDPGSAQQGGDLGWFERGNMVEPFENAAFGLEPGEVSEVVETPFGLHIIKLVDRETPSLDEMGDDFRTQVVNQRRQASLDEYVSGLREPYDLEIQDGAADVARDLAENPSEALRGRAASRRLVSWDDGSLTAQELVRELRRMGAQQRTQLVNLGDERWEGLLQDFATNELVLADAADRGIDVPVEETDSIRALIREQLGQIVRSAGLVGPPQEGETEAEAVDRRVRSLLSGILAGQRNPLPLGALPYALRDQRDWRVHQQALSEVVDGIRARRAPGSPDAGPAPMQQTPEPEPADTTG